MAKWNTPKKWLPLPEDSWYEQEASAAEYWQEKDEEFNKFRFADIVQFEVQSSFVTTMAYAGDYETAYSEFRNRYSKNIKKALDSQRGMYLDAAQVRLLFGSK